MKSKVSIKKELAIVNSLIRRAERDLEKKRAELEKLQKLEKSCKVQVLEKGKIVKSFMVRDVQDPLAACFDCAIVSFDKDGREVRITGPGSRDKLSYTFDRESLANLLGRIDWKKRKKELEKRYLPVLCKKFDIEHFNAMQSVARIDGAFEILRPLR